MASKELWIVLIVLASIGVILAPVLAFQEGYRRASAQVVYRDGAAPIRVPVDGKMIEVPADSEVVIEYEDADDAYAMAEKLRATGSGQGAAVYESGSNIKGDFQAAPMSVELNGAASTGGGWKGKISALGGANAVTILAVLGGLAILGGAVLIAKGFTGIGIGLIVGGGLCLVAVFYPWVLLVLAALALSGLGYIIYRAYAAAKAKADAENKAVTLKAVVRGVSNTSAEVYEAVKAEVKKAAVSLEAKDTVKAEVATVLNGGAK